MLHIAKFNPSTPPPPPPDWNDIKDKVLDYLNAGAIVFISMERGDDEVDTAKGAVVPVGFRTDGTWAWSMDLPYYVEHYSMPIDPELLAYMRSYSFWCAQASPDEINQASEELQKLSLAHMPSVPVSLENAMDIAKRVFPVFSEPIKIKWSWEEELQAWYVWQEVRGGGAVLVSSQDGSFLFAHSSVPTDKHFEEFAKGRRTDPATLEGPTPTPVVETPQEEHSPLKGLGDFLIKGANGEPEIPADWPRIDPALAKRVVDYLDAGKNFLYTNATMADILEPARGEVVPLGASTDGTWYWGEWVPYYIGTYGLSPGDEFLRYLEQCYYVMPKVSEARAKEALDQYLRPQRLRRFA